MNDETYPDMNRVIPLATVALVERDQYEDALYK